MELTRRDLLKLSALTAAVSPLGFDLRPAQAATSRAVKASRSAPSRCTPMGSPHGPQPGLAEKALGATSTSELAVMCDTFRPLRLGDFTQTIANPDYMFSWYQPPADAPAEPGTIA